MNWSLETGPLNLWS